MNTTLRDGIIDKIKNAFEHVPYPGDENISSYSEVRDYDGKRWNELSLDFIVGHRSNLALLTGDAFRFYLPAYLITALLYPKEVDTLIDSLLYNLAPPDLIPVSNISAYQQEVNDFNSKINIFSSEEKAAIAMFVLSFTQLFPNGSWNTLESEHERLNSATKFWSMV